MAGLVPAISIYKGGSASSHRDDRHKTGNDVSIFGPQHPISNTSLTMPV
jgi:hypothetical protein